MIFKRLNQIIYKTYLIKKICIYTGVLYGFIQMNMKNDYKQSNLGIQEKYLNKKKRKIIKFIEK